MITYVDSDLFQSPAQVLVNPVNTVGVMGKGLAGEFRKIYPEMFATYRELCERRKFSIGQLWLYKTPHKWILNFPTKEHWRNKSKPEYIEKGLQKFVHSYAERNITSISFPMLGCGNGELDWETQVKPLMERYLRPLPLQILIHIYPQGRLVPERLDSDAVRTWLRGEPEAMPFQEFWNDLGKLTESRTQFLTLDGSTSFQATLNEDGLLVRLEDSNPIHIPRDEHGLLDFWLHLRSAGYCTPSNLPFGLATYAPYLFGLFLELEYFQRVTLTDTEGRSETGVQLSARSREDVKNMEIAPKSVMR